MVSSPGRPSRDCRLRSSSTIRSARAASTRGSTAEPGAAMRRTTTSTWPRTIRSLTCRTRAGSSAENSRGMRTRTSQYRPLTERISTTSSSVPKYALPVPKPVIDRIMGQASNPCRGERSTRELSPLPRARKDLVGGAQDGLHLVALAPAQIDGDETSARMSPPLGIGGEEDGDGGDAAGHAEVHGAGVVGDEGPGEGEERSQLAKIRRGCQMGAAAGGLHHGARERFLPGAPQDHRHEGEPLRQANRELAVARGIPAADGHASAGVEHEEAVDVDPLRGEQLAHALTRRFVSRQRGLELAPRLRDAEGREQRKLDRHVLDHVRGWWNRVVEEVARRAAIVPDDEAWPDRASEKG